MTRRRKLTLMMVAVVALGSVLALPAVHWRLIGWANAEPFWQGRPASYWSAAIARCEANEVWYPGNLVFPEGEPYPFNGTRFERRIDYLERAAIELREHLPAALAWDGPYPSPMPDSTADAVPMLTALLSDPEAKVRFFAAGRLGGQLGQARSSVPALRRLLSDGAAVTPTKSVRDAARTALGRIDPESLRVIDAP
jgi:hypothetical protein